jgi:hypothetical protein
VTPKQILRITFTLLAVSIASLAAAAPNKDAATLKKIDEAINVHYIAAQFDKAESLLQAAIKDCGIKSCSGEVLGKAYIYLGVIRGNGKQDLAGARRAFENAQGADPNVTLDATLVTPAVLSEFNKVMGKEPDGEPAKAEAKPVKKEDKAAPPEEEPDEAPAKKPKGRVAPVGDLRCSPAMNYEIQTARPIPIDCERMDGVVRGELYYKPVGADDYTAVLMKFDTARGSLRAQIPCEALAKKGALNVYVIAQDENKDMVDTFGNALSPVQYTIVDKTSQPAPMFTGDAAPPKRCTSIASDESEGAGPGEVCTADVRCRSDHYCNSGICRKTPSCEGNADCESSKCESGRCVMHEEFASGGGGASRWMFGLNVGMDLWMSSAAKNVCGGDNAANGTYSCYNTGSTRINIDPVNVSPGKTNRIPMADPNWGGNVKATLVPATFRIMASADYILTPTVTVGGRLGIALGGGPSTIHYDQGVPSQNKSFFPVHAELRAAYWFTPLNVTGMHPYIGLGFGMAEVDAKISLKAWANDPVTHKPTVARSLDAWRKMGRSFAALNFGGLYMFAKRHGAQLNFNVMYMLPSTGLVIEPSLGYVLMF